MPLSPPVIMYSPSLETRTLWTLEWLKSYFCEWFRLAIKLQPFVMNWVGVFKGCTRLHERWGSKWKCGCWSWLAVEWKWQGVVGLRNIQKKLSIHQLGWYIAAASQPLSNCTKHISSSILFLLLLTVCFTQVAANQYDFQQFVNLIPIIIWICLLPGCCQSGAHCEASFHWQWRQQGGERDSLPPPRPLDSGKGMMERSTRLRLREPCNRFWFGYFWEHSEFSVHMCLECLCSWCYCDTLTWEDLQKLCGQGAARACCHWWPTPARRWSPRKRLCARDRLRLRAEWEPGVRSQSWY